MLFYPFYHFAREELEALGEAHRLTPEDPYTAPWLPASLMARLLRFGWPGNIRQLRNLTRQLVIGSRGRAQVTFDPRLSAELGEDLAPPAGVVRPAQGPPGKPRRRPSEVSEAALLAALRESAWDLKGASDRLGIPRSSIYDVIDRCPSIRTAGDLDAAEIEQCYAACGGDLDAMVQRLQVSGRALKRRLKELGLEGKRA